MTEKEKSIQYFWLNTLAILILLAHIGLVWKQQEINKLKHEQIRIYNRINYMEQALTTKDKELEQYLIKEAQK